MLVQYCDMPYVSNNLDAVSNMLLNSNQFYNCVLTV